MCIQSFQRLKMWSGSEKISLNYQTTLAICARVRVQFIPKSLSRSNVSKYSIKLAVWFQPSVVSSVFMLTSRQCMDLFTNSSQSAQRTRVSFGYY
ncbi:hypothetical protein T10_9205 [Trichinella papuae]|uniref:Uncharacterized protein n=1 Tax=Trichinella papuae TaxID=268474 RepID=A0A0V1N6N1_9BILA|nr:hypothetical protein T10_9205 [Trichinella papuae]